jgi:trehalose-6-phosphatase
VIDAGLRTRLEEIAGAPVLLVACDYDGTLSPLVADSSASVPDTKALAALAQTRVGSQEDVGEVLSFLEGARRSFTD